MSFVHSSHLVRQLGGKLTHQSELYVSDLTNRFDTFTHDAPRIRITHHVDPALLFNSSLSSQNFSRAHTSFFNERIRFIARVCEMNTAATHE